MLRAGNARGIRCLSTSAASRVRAPLQREYRRPTTENYPCRPALVVPAQALARTHETDVRAANASLFGVPSEIGSQQHHRLSGYWVTGKCYVGVPVQKQALEADKPAGFFVCFVLFFTFMCYGHVCVCVFESCGVV